MFSLQLDFKINKFKESTIKKIRDNLSYKKMESLLYDNPNYIASVDIWNGYDFIRFHHPDKKYSFMSKSYLYKQSLTGREPYTKNIDDMMELWTVYEVDIEAIYNINLTIDDRQTGKTTKLVHKAMCGLSKDKLIITVSKNNTRNINRFFHLNGNIKVIDINSMFEDDGIGIAYQELYLDEYQFYDNIDKLCNILNYCIKRKIPVYGSSSLKTQ